MPRPARAREGAPAHPKLVVETWVGKQASLPHHRRSLGVLYGPMVVLRADPWNPDYGMGFQATVEERPLATDPFVETEDWTVPRSAPAHPPGPLWFVDGVRRVELRLIVDDEGRRAPGLFGSFAVGAVRCEGVASFADHSVGRAVVAGGGILPEPVEIRSGPTTLLFEPHCDPGNEPDRPLWTLQQRMQKSEGELASRIAAEEDPGRVVVVDGPLTFSGHSRAPVVGMIKRFVRHYLESPQENLLARLGPGQRTPLFELGGGKDPIHRFAWYTRLVDLRIPWHDQAGIVRCEVRAGLGAAEAARLADAVTAALPRYAGRSSDPRAPQNLAPVGGLERWLRHRLGDQGFVRRGLMRWLVTAGRAEG